MRGFEIIGPFSIRVNATPTFPYESDSITRVIVSRDDPHSGEEISSEHYPSHSSSGAERRENKRLREEASQRNLSSDEVGTIFGKRPKVHEADEATSEQHPVDTEKEDLKRKVKELEGKLEALVDKEEENSNKHLRFDDENYRLHIAFINKTVRGDERVSSTLQTHITGNEREIAVWSMISHDT